MSTITFYGVDCKFNGNTVYFKDADNARKSKRNVFIELVNSEWILANIDASCYSKIHAKDFRGKKYMVTGNNPSYKDALDAHKNNASCFLIDENAPPIVGKDKGLFNLDLNCVSVVVIKDQGQDFQFTGNTVTFHEANDAAKNAHCRIVESAGRKFLLNTDMKVCSAIWNATHNNKNYMIGKNTLSEQDANNACRAGVFVAVSEGRKFLFNDECSNAAPIKLLHKGKLYNPSHKKFSYHHCKGAIREGIFMDNLNGFWFLFNSEAGVYTSVAASTIRGEAYCQSGNLLNFHQAKKAADEQKICSIEKVNGEQVLANHSMKAYTEIRHVNFKGKKYAVGANTLELKQARNAVKEGVAIGLQGAANNGGRNFLFNDEMMVAAPIRQIVFKGNAMATGGNDCDRNAANSAAEADHCEILKHDGSDYLCNFDANIASLIK